MTTIVLLLATLALILLPLAFVTLRQRSSRAARIAHAWHSAREKEQHKATPLDAIEQRLAAAVASEQALLDSVRQLRQRIAELPADTPDNQALREIESATESAIGKLAELMESQLDADGQPRLKAPANDLAARHADSGTAIARLEDVLDEEKAASPQRSTDNPPDAADAVSARALDEAEDREDAADKIGLLLQDRRPEAERRIH